MKKLRIHKANSYAYIVRDEYDPNKGGSRPITLKSLGKVEKILERPEGWAWAEQALANFQMELYLNERESQEPSRVAQRYRFGEVAFLKLMDELKLHSSLKAMSNNSKLPKWTAKATCLMAMQRALDPSSKLPTLHHFEQSAYDVSDIELQHLSETLGHIAPRKQTIVKALHEGAGNFGARDLSVLVYDASAFVERLDDALPHPMSNDHKTQETQLLLGLLVDGEGCPLTYELFSGDTANVDTFMSFVMEFVKQYNLDPKRLTVVADAGFNQAGKIKAMQEQGLRYMVGLKPWSRLVEPYQERLLKEEDWVDYAPGARYKALDGTLKRQVLIEDKNAPFALDARLIGSFSQARKHQDLGVLDKTTPMPSKQGKSPKTFELNVDELVNQTVWAGYGTFLTNIPESERGALELFKLLHQKEFIEDNFRIMKSGFETHPDEPCGQTHIRGHVLVCYIALLLNQVLVQKLKEKGFNYSLQTIRRALLSPTLFQPGDAKDKVYVSYDLQSNATVLHHIFEALDLQPLPEITTHASLQRHYTKPWLRMKYLGQDKKD